MAFDTSARIIVSWLEAERIDRTPELTQEIKNIAKNLDSTAERLFLDMRDLRSEWLVADFNSFWTRFEKAFTNALETYKNV